MVAKSNISLVLSSHLGEGLQASMEGRLFPLVTQTERRWYRIKNWLLWGCFQKRVLNSLYYTFITFCLELTNPLERESLKKVMALKGEIGQRFLGKCLMVNGEPWDQSNALYNLKLYQRGSLLQYYEILWMEKALQHNKEPEIVKRAKEGIQKGYTPILEIHGASGTYWMRGERRELLGLFKPFDEELCGPNNPVGPTHQGTLGQRKVRRSMRVGESPHREVAAYLLDDYCGFGLVPKTYYASFEHSNFFLSRLGVGSDVVKKKMGSFQEYVEGLKSLYQCSPDEAKTIQTEALQLLVLFDVIIGNADRHANNIMIKEGRVIAIDNGLAFPDINWDLSTWHWAILEQLSKPFPKEMVRFLENFPLEKIASKLSRHCFLDKRVFDRMRERIALFSAGLSQGYAPSQLIDVMSNENLQELKDLHWTLKEKAMEKVKLLLSGFPGK